MTTWGDFENLRADPQLVQDGDKSKSKLVNAWENPSKVLGPNFLGMIMMVKKNKFSTKNVICAFNWPGQVERDGERDSAF